MFLLLSYIFSDRNIYIVGNQYLYTMKTDDWKTRFELWLESNEIKLRDKYSNEPFEQEWNE